MLGTDLSESLCRSQRPLKPIKHGRMGDTVRVLLKTFEVLKNLDSTVQQNTKQNSNDGNEWHPRAEIWESRLKKKLLKSQCCVIHALHHGKMMEKLKYQHFFYEEKESFFQVKCKKEIAPFLYTQREYSANYSHRCSWNLIFESVNSNEFATQITP